MVYAHIGRQLQELLQLVLIGAYIHGCSRQYIGWTDEYGETYTVDKLANILHTGKCAPFGLVDTTLGEHGRELGTVFGIVDILGRCTQDWHILGIEPHGKVVRNLSTGRHHHAMRILHLDDVKHTLEGELVKVETVTHIIVGRYGLWVVVNHNRAVALSAYGVERLHSTPVKLY